MNSILDSTEKANIKNERLNLLPEKAIYWGEKELLLIADLHLGKTNHFRKAGIAVPKNVPDTNWKMLHQLFQAYKPKRVCFLGDLFHSNHNKEWKDFSDLIKNYSPIQFELVLGNHDILHPEVYHELSFKVYSESLIEAPFILTHEPIETSEFYNLAGHIHPGVKLNGSGRQSLRAPCFYFGKNQGILPAFGSFTGLSLIKKVKKEDQVYVIATNKVIPL